MANGRHGDDLGGRLCDQLFSIMRSRFPDLVCRPLKSKCTFHRGRNKRVLVNIEHRAGHVVVRPFGKKEHAKQAFDRRGIVTTRENGWANYELGGIGKEANIEEVAMAAFDLLTGFEHVGVVHGDGRVDSEELKITEFDQNTTVLHLGRHIPPALPRAHQMGTVATIAAELNRLSAAHLIGSLQKRRQGLKRGSFSGRSMFDSQTTFDTYAYHYGGRSELQFNIGIEGIYLRYGVAFSFEPSRALPWKEMEAVLLPKARLFNAFIELNPESFRDMRMWYHDNDHRLGPDEMPGPIPWDRVRPGVFAFLGQRQEVADVNCELILSDFDRLLPLYIYIESGGLSQPVPILDASLFNFKSGCSRKASSTLVTPAQRQLDIDLRHNKLQQELHRRLVRQYGAINVGTEIVSGVGTRVDVVVRESEEFYFYEIKTAESARGCLRQAVGQLLEYALWPGAQWAARLIVVGEAAIDADGQEYLRRLRDHFSLPIEYQQITPEMNKSVP
jgi:hypothetical protein